MNNTEFIKAMKPIYKAFGKEVDQEQLAIYYGFLKHLDYTTLTDCIRILIGSESYFPPIAKYFDVLRNNIRVPSQAKVHNAITQWMGGETDRNVDNLEHPIYKMMAEEMGVLYRFSISQKEFDDIIKYRYKRIVEEYKDAVINDKPLRLPEGGNRNLYPYKSSTGNKKLGDVFINLKFDNKLLKANNGKNNI